MQKLEYQLTRPTIQDFIKTVSTAHTHNIIYNILYHIVLIIDVFIYILYYIVLIDILYFL